MESQWTRSRLFFLKKKRKDNPSPSKEGEMDRELSPGIRERSTKRRDWKPGETKKEQGKRILGYRPSYQTNLETMKKDLCSVQFVIKKKGMPNLIALSIRSTCRPQSNKSKSQAT